MPKVPKKIADRISSGLKKFQPILGAAKDRDLNEADTCTIITDFLSEAMGYDKYSEITSEFAIRGTYCDLAILIEDKPHMLIEVKAAGLDLKENHIKQAADYAANQGLEWVCLTNGTVWKVFKIKFTKPIEREQFIDVNVLEMSNRAQDDIQKLYLLAREGIVASALSDYYTQRQALNRQTIAAVILSEPVVKIVRRELDRLAPEVKVPMSEVAEMLRGEVIKRDLVSGKEAEAEVKRIHRALKGGAKLRRTKKQEAAEPS